MGCQSRAVDAHIVSDKPLRILTLATLFPSAARPNFGIFVERQTAALAARDGMDVTVINPVGLPPWPISLTRRYGALNALDAQENWRGLNVYRPKFTLIPKFGGPINPAMIARAVLPLAKKLHAQNPFDLIDAEFFYPDGPAAMRIAKALGIPFTIKARGSDIHYWAAFKRSKDQILKAADNASAILAVSAALKGDMTVLGMDPGKITVHYTGLDKGRFVPRDRESEKAKLGIAGPLVLCVGALIFRKNQSLLIEALRNLPGVSLMLVGQGENEGDFRQLARQVGVADRVHFTGNIAHDDLPRYFAAADIMALVSCSEGLANAWVEALACGTPVVASNVGGAPELIRNKAAGRIIEPNIDEIVAAISELLAYPPVSQDVTEAVAHFSWEENARNLETVFRSVIQKVEVRDSPFRNGPLL